MAVCTNVPENIVGPFEHTLFLGCSVRSFSCSLGWNEQESSVTVELVEDPCPVPKPHDLTNEKRKRYYPRPGQELPWYVGDPGFQTPAVGGPVYFKAQNFEFAGLVQSWTRKNDTSGNPTYSVTITDPRFLLQNLTVITGDYAGDVKSVPNLINAYGYLESLSPFPPGDPDDCPQELIKGAAFGSPAGGFGYSHWTQEGVPWRRIKGAIAYLLSGNTHPEFSPLGMARFRGHPSVTPISHGYQMGRLPFDGQDQQIVTDFKGVAQYNDYFVDISELAELESFYKINSPSSSLQDLISQICGDSGCDYFVELLVTTQNAKVIKVKTVKRTTQPALGIIESYIDSPMVPGLGNVNPEGGYGGLVTTKDLGRELRNEPTSVFMYGANVQTLYEVRATGFDGVYDPTGNIIPFFGYDVSGDMLKQVFLKGERWGEEYEEWAYEADILKLSAGMSRPLKSGAGFPPVPTAVTGVFISETELRSAMGDYNAWYSYTFMAGATGTGANPTDPAYGTPLGRLFKYTYSSGSGYNFPMTMGGPKTQLPLDQDGNVNAAGMSDLRAGRTNIGPSNIMAMGSTGNPLLKDLHMAHEFVKSVGEEHYGKSYLVKAPNICYYSDSGLSDASLFRSSKPKYIWSDVPSSDGGYPATTDSAGTGTGFYTLLDLPYPSTGADYFSDDVGKINGITLFPNPSGSGNNSVKGDFVLYNSGVYGKLTAEGEPELFKTGQGPFEYDSTTGTLTGDAFNYFDGTVYYFNVGAETTPVAIIKIDPLETGEPSIIPAAGSLGTKSAVPASRKVPPGPTSVKGDIWGTTLKNAMAKNAKRFQPSGVIIPMLSNTTRYGPWGFVGPAGPVKFENNDDLAPWNFGGYAPLWSGATEEVRAALTFMQVGERGSFTVGGYPTKALGQDLKSTFSGMYSLSLQSSNDPEFGAFKYVQTTPMDGAFGPNITNISTSIGEGGATTTYQLSTFTPSFGRMSKMNANRLKTVGSNKAKQRKQLRENLKIKQMLNKIGGVGGGGAGGGGANAPNATNSTPLAQRSRPGDLIVGAHNRQAENTENPDANMAGLDMTETASSDSVTQSNFADMSPDTYKQTAFASQDIFARPVSRFGDGGFPQYATPTNLVCGSGSIPPQPQGPFLEWQAPTIDIVYYDPFPSTGDNKHIRVADGEGNEVQDHHDISVMAFGEGTGEHRNKDTFDLLEYEFENTGFPDDYRFMATRGPLLIHGWGYDTNGKPIPNHADVEDDARAGVFTNENLTDYFPSGWLRKPGAWPVAPLDLRFDRDRGVWTVPGPPKMLAAKADLGAITAGNTGACTVLDSLSVYDGDGSSIASPHIIVKADSAIGGEIEADEAFYAFYDDVECVWLPLMPGNSTSFPGGGSLCFYDKAFCFGQIYDDDTANVGPPCIDYDNPLTNFDDGQCLESNICIENFTSNILIGTGLKAWNCEWSALYDCCGEPTSGTQIDLYLPIANSQKIPNLDINGNYKYAIYKGNEQANPYCMDEYTAVDYGYGLVVENLNLVDGVGCPDFNLDAENIDRCPTYRVALDKDYETKYTANNTCTDQAGFQMTPRGTQALPMPPSQKPGHAPEKESHVHYSMGLFAEDQGDTVELQTDHRLYYPQTDPPDKANIKSFSSLAFRNNITLTPIPNLDVVGRKTSLAANNAFCDYYIDAADPIWSADNVCCNPDEKPVLTDQPYSDILLGRGLCAFQADPPERQGQLTIETNHTIGYSDKVGGIYYPPIADVECAEFACLIFGEGIDVTQVMDGETATCDYLIEAPHVAASRPYWYAPNQGVGFCCEDPPFSPVNPKVQPTDIVISNGLCGAYEPLTETFTLQTNHTVGEDDEPADNAPTATCNTFGCLIFGSGLELHNIPNSCDYRVTVDSGGCEDGETVCVCVVSDVTCNPAGDGFEISYTNMCFENGCLVSVDDTCP